MNIKPEIANDIEAILKVANTAIEYGETMGWGSYPTLKESCSNVEAFLATLQPNHLDDKTLDH